MNTPANSGSHRPPSLFERIASARNALVAGGFTPEDAALDAEVLARHVLGWDRVRLVADGRAPGPPWFPDRFEVLIARRLNHEPIAMITGHREFWDLDFRVTPATLVPRPETELIVEEALRVLPLHDRATILDIGTGTGCLAIALAYERPAARVLATDRSHDALLVARRNAAAHLVSNRVFFVCTDLAAGLAVRADLIVSNPPYVPESAAGTLPRDVAAYEPPTALFGGPDGLSVIRRLLTTLPHHLAPGGRFIVEFGFGQEAAVRDAAAREGWVVERVLQDLQGIDRTMVLTRGAGEPESG